MNFIKTWTFCICVTLIVSVIFISLTPKGSVGKFYRIIISIFIFISFLYPLSNFNFNDFRPNFRIEKNYDDFMVNSVDKQIENLVEKTLCDNGINSSKISVETSIIGEEININKVSVSVIDDYDKDEVEKIIFDNIGIVANVKQIGE